MSVDVSRARPGGLLRVTLPVASSRDHASAIFLGKRHPFFLNNGDLRALVPVPLGTPAGATILGIEARQRRRYRRIAIDVTTSAGPQGRRTVTLPPAKMQLLKQPDAARDGRRILSLMRTVTPRAHWRGSFKSPVDAPPSPSFGLRETLIDGAPFYHLYDGLSGEFHNGLDFAVPMGTVVQAPAAGTILLASTMTASGRTIVIDHGQGILSVLFHLSRIEVRAGQWIEGRGPIALSGDSGLVAAPTLSWNVYIGGVAVDPRELYTLID